MELDAFNDGELGLDETAKMPVPARQVQEPQPESFDDVVESTNLSTREGNRTVRELADNDYFGREGAAMGLPALSQRSLRVCG